MYDTWQATVLVFIITHNVWHLAGHGDIIYHKA